MPATSRSQQRLFCMALAVRKGDLARSKVSKSVLDIVDGDMTNRQIEDFIVLKESGMIHLKDYISESILSSTGAGKEAVIKNWIDKNINIHPKFYKIENDRIKFTTDTVLVYPPEETPNYIKFDDIHYLITDENISALTKDQLPPHIEKIYISNKKSVLPECELTVGRDFTCTCKHFDKIVLHCSDKNGSKRTSLEFPHVDDINEFRNLYVDTKGKVDITQLSRKVMDQFGFLVKQGLKEREAFRKKYFPHVENLVWIDMKEYGNLNFE